MTEASELGFDAAWLDLREPADHRSRAEELLEPLRAWWSRRSASSVLDLGCGTGSNLRYLAPRLPRGSAWTLIDHDAALLARVRPPVGPYTLRVLHEELTETSMGAVGAAQLVTASALLDLVSESWLVGLVDACTSASCAALFALTYDGRIEWSGSASGLADSDGLVSDAVNAHQRRDKGFGPALGPTATDAVERLFRARGYRTWVRASDWVLGASDAALVDALVDGWARAASEQHPEGAEKIRAWAAHRRRSERGDLTLRVGHQDILALPPDTRGR